MSDSKITKPVKAILLSLLGVALLVGLSFGAGLFGNKDAEVPAVEETTTDTTAAPMTEETPAPVAEEPTPVVSEEIDMAAVKAPRTIGSNDAPVKIIEYASLTCHHCKQFHTATLPEMKTKYIDTGLVQIEFREFPLNAPALEAAMLARCLPADKYEGYTSLLFKTQEEWTAKPDYIASLRQNAKLAGLTDAQADACLASPEVKQFVAANVKEGTEKWKVESTPTFIVNEKEKISGAMPMYEFERVFRLVTGGKVGAIDQASDATPMVAPTETTVDETPDAPEAIEDAAPAPVTETPDAETTE